MHDVLELFFERGVVDLFLFFNGVFFEILFVFCLFFLIAFVYCLTSSAEHVVRNESFSEFEFSFCDVAVTASLYGVGVVVGEGFSGDAGIVSEEAVFVEFECVFSECDGLFVWCVCGL